MWFIFIDRLAIGILTTSLRRPWALQGYEHYFKLQTRTKTRRTHFLQHIRFLNINRVLKKKDDFNKLLETLLWGSYNKDLPHIRKCLWPTTTPRGLIPLCQRERAHCSGTTWSLAIAQHPATNVIGSPPCNSPFFARAYLLSRKPWTIPIAALESPVYASTVFPSLYKKAYLNRLQANASSGHNSLFHLRAWKTGNLQ